MGELLLAIKDAADTIAAPNWAVAISAFAAVGTVLVAVLIALKQIKIAKEQNEITKKQNEIAQKQIEISEQQNKIALFKERYSVYCELQKSVRFGKEVKKLFDTIVQGYSVSSISILNIGLLVFGLKPSTESPSLEELSLALTVQIESSKYLVKQAIFLFDGIEEKDIDDLFNSLLGYIVSLVVFKDFAPDNGDHISSTCERFYDKYMKKIERTLNLR